MNGFKIFDGNANQFDNRPDNQEHRWYTPGTKVKIIFPRFEESNFTIQIA